MGSCGGTGPASSAKSYPPDATGTRMTTRPPDRPPPGPSPFQLGVVVGVTALVAMMMYVDRGCFGVLADPIQTEIGLADGQRGDILGAFYLTYALFQIPIGSLADRYGARTVLAVSVFTWSVVTALTGLADSFAGLLLCRLLLGVTESGAYPAAAGLVKNWAPVRLRGACSGAIAPYMTAWLGLHLAGVPLMARTDDPSGFNWRGVFVTYGGAGVVIAMFFWAFVRSRPPGSVTTGPRPADPFAAKLGMLARSRNMWLSGAFQFATNIGWAPLVTLFPTYLAGVFHVPIGDRGRMQSFALAAGCLGMMFGGPLTDFLRVRIGPRFGRSAAPVVTALGASAVLFLAPTLPSAWAVAAALGVMAFLVDLHNPSMWAFAQDVGGRHVGAAMGWGNMWGNLGAALASPLLARVVSAYGWDAAFAVEGGAFAAAAVIGLFLDARRPVEPEPPPEDPSRHPPEDSAAGHPASR